MAGSAWPASVAIISGRLTFARLPIGRLPTLGGDAHTVAVGSIIGVPVLAACFPRWAGRVTMPLIGITSAGVYATVPDIERVSLVMLSLLAAAIYSVAKKSTPDRIVVAATALLIMGVAILDSGGRGAAIVRAAGCFGVLLAAPVAGWLNELRTDGTLPRRPTLSILVIVHCLVVAWSSRGLIRETSVGLVVTAVGGALIAAVVILCVLARPVSAEP
jgi:hypothetical protein